MHDVTVGDSLRSYEVYATLLLVACAAVAEGVFFIFFFLFFVFVYVVSVTLLIQQVVFTGWLAGVEEELQKACQLKYYLNILQEKV